MKLTEASKDTVRAIEWAISMALMTGFVAFLIWISTKLGNARVAP